MSPPKARRITPFVTIHDGMARYFLIFECGTIAAATPQRVGKRTGLRRMVSAPSTIIAIVFDGSPRLRQPRGEADPPSVAGLHAIRLPLQTNRPTYLSGSRKTTTSRIRSRNCDSASAPENG